MGSEEIAREGRRSPCIVAGIPLDVWPVQRSCCAVTAVINLHGALIVSPVPWPSGTILQIQNQKNKRTVRARVVWTGPEDAAGSYKLGVEFEAPESRFWGDDYNLDS